jgi:lysozyme family protein
MKPELSFDICFDRLIGHEGGYVDDPHDPGGETNWGISKRSYPQLDIKSLTRADAARIYLTDFWKPVAGSLPLSVTFQLFDFAVNSGIGNAVRCLQRVVGAVPDGVWGQFSKTAAAAFSESDLLMLLLAERLDFLRKTQVWKFDSSGLAGRIANNLRFAAQDNEV